MIKYNRKQSTSGHLRQECLFAAFGASSLFAVPLCTGVLCLPLLLELNLLLKNAHFCLESPWVSRCGSEYADDAITFRWHTVGTCIFFV